MRPDSRYTGLPIVTVAVTFLFLAGCATEPRPAGVSRAVNFSVTALYPNGFEITASGSRSTSSAELQNAWRAKAKMVAKGHRFKSSPLVVHDNESDYGGYWPLLTRSVTGTIRLGGD